MSNITKHQTVLNIESLGYTLQATSQSGGESRVYLVEDGKRIYSVNFMSNNESIQKVRDKLAGELAMRDNTYLSVALDPIYVSALYHTTINNKLEPATIEALVEKLPYYLQKDYSDRVVKFRENSKETIKVAEPEKEMFYLIHAVSVQNLNGKPVHFTNEFVGTERDFNEYKANYGKKPTMKADIERVETFAPEFRATHREIEKIVFAYQNNTGDKSKMLNTLKTFDEEAIVRLEARLKQEGINPKKFESDMKAEPHNKIKPKM